MTTIQTEKLEATLCGYAFIARDQFGKRAYPVYKINAHRFTGGVQPLPEYHNRTFALIGKPGYGISWGVKEMTPELPARHVSGARRLFFSGRDGYRVYDGPDRVLIHFTERREREAAFIGAASIGHGRKEVNKGLVELAVETYETGSKEMVLADFWEDAPLSKLESGPAYRCETKYENLTHAQAVLRQEMDSAERLKETMLALERALNNQFPGYGVSGPKDIVRTAALFA